MRAMPTRWLLGRLLSGAFQAKFGRIFYSNVDSRLAILAPFLIHMLRQIGPSAGHENGNS